MKQVLLESKSYTSADDLDLFKENNLTSTLVLNRSVTLSPINKPSMINKTNYNNKKSNMNVNNYVPLKFHLHYLAGILASSKD